MNNAQHAPAIRIRRLPNGAGISLPTYMTAGAAAADIFAAIDAPTTIASRHTALIGTGFAIQIPEGYEIQIRPRSSLALRGVTVLNTPATIDSDFRGEVCVLLINHGESDFTVQRGDRIAQLILATVLHAEFEEVEELEPSDRGAGGFGSTG